MDLTIAEAESLPKTEYKMFEHTESAKRFLAVDEYSVPASISKYVNFITPTVQHLTATRHSSQRSLLGSQRLLKCKS
jgi:tripeptidyl-peptidase-1